MAKYPEPVEGAQGVFYCGYNSERSFGGSAWLIQREAGNVLVDSPRFDPKLVKNIKVSRAYKFCILPAHKLPGAASIGHHHDCAVQLCSLDINGFLKDSTVNRWQCWRHLMISHAGPGRHQVHLPYTSR